MKKLFKNSLLLMAIITSVIFTACDETEDLISNPPTASLSADAEAYDVGDVASLTVSFEAPEGIVGASIDYATTAEGVSIPSQVLDLNQLGIASDTSGQFILELTIEESLANSTVTVTLNIEDGEAGTTSASVSFDVNEAAPVNTYTAQLLYAPAADGSTNTWFSTNLGETVTEGEVNASANPSSSDIDFGYYYGNTDLATIASPLAYNLAGIDISDWSQRNGTEFKLTTINDEEYIAITSGANLEAAWNRADNINEGGTISSLAVGDVVAFKLDASKGGLYGTFKVLTIVPGNNTNDYIELEVIVEQ